MSESRDSANIDRVQSALHSSRHTGGSTHNFYLYPARFSPEIARAVVETFSQPGDWVLDPFMGGGTSIIEGLTTGRGMIGIDLNALAHFVASVRTRPLSARDEELILQWAIHASASCACTATADLPDVRNLPLAMKRFMAQSLDNSDHLHLPRQRAFARAVLLRLGQWALDCRDYSSPPQAKLAAKLPDLTAQMLEGLRQFVELCSDAGLSKTEILGHRVLLCRNASGLEDERRLGSLRAAPKLVFTSPPYPRVHVLYHRWQIRGRKETPAPYWIAQVADGHDASYYTGGSRTPTGERNYFAMIRKVYSSVRKIIDPVGVVVQLVGFADVNAQLPQYHAAMADAGFEPWSPMASTGDSLWRQVPHRKWYAKLQGAVDASSELLLFHRPKRSRAFS